MYVFHAVVTIVAYLLTRLFKRLLTVVAVLSMAVLIAPVQAVADDDDDDLENCPNPQATRRELKDSFKCNMDLMRPN